MTDILQFLLLAVSSVSAALISDRNPSDPFQQVAVSIPKDAQSVALTRIEWEEIPDAHIFTARVPGLRREEVKIEVEENGVLRISCERRKEEESETDELRRIERWYGKFWRQFTLPDNVNMDGITGMLNDGVLTVRVPKVFTQEPKGSEFVGKNS